MVVATIRSCRFIDGWSVAIRSLLARSLPVMVVVAVLLAQECSVCLCDSETVVRVPFQEVLGEYG